MTATTHIPADEEMKPPALQLGALGWLRANLFSSWLQSLLTVVTVAILAWIIVGLVRWGITRALFDATSAQCIAARDTGGACWAVIREKFRFIMFGRYNYDEQWRPALAVILFIAMTGVSCVRAWWGKWLIWAWTATLVVFGVLMFGGVLGLEYVPTDNWGGLPLTLVIAVVAIVGAFPVGILLALGRRSLMPAIRALSVGYIELIRGVPLITVLFMASVMIPLFFSTGFNVDKLLRAILGFLIFTAAYLAENIRAGLVAVPKGQYEAADALGLSFYHKMRLIVLPQALRIVIPANVNSFISTFKDTSLVIVIGLFDLLNAAKTATSDPEWRFPVEAYVFVAAIYFCFCFFMSKYSQRLERDLAKATKR